MLPSPASPLNSQHPAVTAALDKAAMEMRAGLAFYASRQGAGSIATNLRSRMGLAALSPAFADALHDFVSEYELATNGQRPRLRK